MSTVRRVVRYVGSYPTEEGLPEEETGVSVDVSDRDWVNRVRCRSLTKEEHRFRKRISLLMTCKGLTGFLP